MNFEMSKGNTIERIGRLMELAGQKRFKKIIQVYHTKTPATGWTATALEYEYMRIVTDCWEGMNFTNRLHSKGFFRYSPEAIERYMEDLMNTMRNASNHNLI